MAEEVTVGPLLTAITHLLDDDKRSMATMNQRLVCLSKRTWGSLTPVAVTDEKNTSRSTFRAGPASGMLEVVVTVVCAAAHTVFRAKNFNLPFAATHTCVVPIYPMLSGGTEPASLKTEHKK